MREFKIFIVLLVFTAVVYWGVEPYAHSQMHEHTPAANFDFKSLDISEAERKLAAAKAANSADEVEYFSQLLASTKELYERVDAITAHPGDAEKGEETFSENCLGCHSGDMQMSGIVVPDLSTAGAIYDHHFLAAIMIDPALAMKNNKKFNDENPHPMAVSLEDEEIADILAYLAKTGKGALDEKITALADEINSSKLSDAEKAAAVEKATQKLYFAEACGRCHDVKYDDFIANTNGAELVEYMGSTPPDLSMIIRAKGSDYLAKFINDTQKQLPGTAMPRVGLNEHAQEQVISYLEKVGDSKKAEREDLAYYIMGFFALLALLAYGWKSAIWRELH